MTLQPKKMLVAGVMSGTSADGVDVALVRVSPGRPAPTLEVLGHRGFAYPGALRKALLRVMGGEAVGAGEMSRLSWRLGEVYADCVEQACAQMGVRGIELVGMHGQTVYHQGSPQRYAGAPVRATWQIGEAAVVRERLGCPVVSDFRPADLAAGGQGAPLVPMLDFCMFRSTKVNRVLLNLGGIANVTVIAAGAGLDEVMAFDTGPANMVVDALMKTEFGKKFDRGGRVAEGGRVMDRVVKMLAGERYFREAPPKSCGREEFGEGFAAKLLGMCKAEGGSAADAVTTATELTAVSVVRAYERFCAARMRGGATEVIAAGGGVRNECLMERLREAFGRVGVEVRAMDEFGLKSEAKEAVAFALLGWLSWNQMAGNVPSATGARGPRVLGKVSW